MEYVEYVVDDGVATITLNRPKVANALNPAFLTEIDQAWRDAEGDASVRVIVVAAAGKHFSSGHDLNSPPEDIPNIDSEYGIGRFYRWEEEVFFGYTRRWRDCPKPTIAAVQGACIAAGLMIAWPCDIIVASEDARFGDPIIRLGVGAGVEYHGHTWELGPRKAKELLFTAGFVGADEAHRLGMVNRVVPREKLHEAVTELAREIACMDPFALRMAKRAVNVTMDIQGFHSSLHAVFDMHWVGHAHAYALTGSGKSPLRSASEMAADNEAGLKTR